MTDEEIRITQVVFLAETTDCEELGDALGAAAYNCELVEGDQEAPVLFYKTQYYKELLSRSDDKHKIIRDDIALSQNLRMSFESGDDVDEELGFGY